MNRFCPPLWARIALLTTLLSALVGCSSERQQPIEGADAGHPVPISADQTCRGCHPAPGESATEFPEGPGAPVWHVLDCCGPDWADCGDCHRPQGFQPPIFDHDQQPDPVGDALQGNHRRPPEIDEVRGRPARCNRCHRPDGALAGGPVPEAPEARAEAEARCFDCHLDDRPGVSHGFTSARCGDCHVPTGFAGARPDHAVIGGWPLEATHNQIRCSACHVLSAEATPQRIQSDCACCHTEAALAAPVQHRWALRWRPAQPDDDERRAVCGPQTRLEGVEAADCNTCHNVNGFGPDQAPAFEHPVAALAGAHAGTREVGGRDLPLCDRCHLSRGDDGQPPERGCGDADGCHAAEHALARNLGGPHDPLPTDCSDCHRIDDPLWAR